MSDEQRTRLDFQSEVNYLTTSWVCVLLLSSPWALPQRLGITTVKLNRQAMDMRGYESKNSLFLGGEEVMMAINRRRRIIITVTKHIISCGCHCAKGIHQSFVLLTYLVLPTEYEAHTLLLCFVWDTGHPYNLPQVFIATRECQQGTNLGIPRATLCSVKN